MSAGGFSALWHRSLSEATPAEKGAHLPQLERERRLEELTRRKVRRVSTLNRDLAASDSPLPLHPEGKIPVAVGWGDVLVPNAAVHPVAAALAALPQEMHRLAANVMLLEEAILSAAELGYSAGILHGACANAEALQYLIEFARDCDLEPIPLAQDESQLRLIFETDVPLFAVFLPHPERPALNLPLLQAAESGPRACRWIALCESGDLETLLKLDPDGMVGVLELPSAPIQG